MAPKDTRLHIALSGELRKELEELANKEQRSLAAVVRLAIKDRIARAQEAGA